MATTNQTTTNANDRLPSGTRVFNTNDAEPGTIVGCLGSNAGRATSYYVDTAYGREVWKARDTQAIEPHD